MSEAKFTPAPWVMHEPQGLSCSWSFDFEAMELGSSIELDEFKANTSLIEIAPDMYNLIEDLRHAISMGGIGGGINNSEVLKSIDETLAKARGEQNA